MYQKLIVKTNRMCLKCITFVIISPYHIIQILLFIFYFFKDTDESQTNMESDVL